jgi:hypothetical protein
MHDVLRLGDTNGVSVTRVLEQYHRRLRQLRGSSGQAMTNGVA